MVELWYINKYADIWVVKNVVVETFSLVENPCFATMLSIGVQL
jgi:hypothetical protein